MKTIHKVQLQLTNGLQSVNIPIGSTILCVNVQDDLPTTWYECSLPIQEEATVKFIICGTGWEFNEQYQYLDTVFINSFVWHIYIMPNSEVKVK